jgi:hypothetical protein
LASTVPHFMGCPVMSYPSEHGKAKYASLEIIK